MAAREIQKIIYPKINLGLFIKGKRMDGYHEIETALYPIQNFHDILTISRSSKSYFEFQQTGLTIPSPIQENLIYRAWMVVKQEYGINEGLCVNLHKGIPAGAGLGGGSANAAATLLILNELFDIGITSDRMHLFARTMGADVPFFIHNQPVIARGIGDEFEPIHLPYHFKVEVITPPFHSSTLEAYKALNLADCSTHKDLKSILLGDIAAWKNHLTNDFENIIFKKFPELADIKQTFYNEGAIYASMSGTGSAVFGLFL